MAQISIFLRLGIASILASSLSMTAEASRPRTSSSDVLHILQGRDLTCADSTFSSCSKVDPRLPGDFCCKPDHSCISLDSASTVLCCPSSADCSAITTISCDITAQNATAHPGAPVQTTKLGTNLITCGTNCCPFGYTCQLDSQGNGTCLIITDKSSLSPNFSASSAATSSVASSSTTTSAVASSTTVAGIDSTTPPPKNQCPRFPSAAIAAGFFPGALAGVFLTLLMVLLCGARNSRNNRPTSNTSSLYKPQLSRNRSATGKILGISNPIPLESRNTRTDFLRRTTSKAKALFSPPRSPRGTFANMSIPTLSEGNWKMPTPPEMNNIPIYPPGNTIPVTPEPHSRTKPRIVPVTKQPSTESIRVYSPHTLLRPSPPHSQSYPSPSPIVANITTTTITPVRGMTSQRPPIPRGYTSPPQQTTLEKTQTDHSKTIGSPFKTPNKNLYNFPESVYGDDRSSSSSSSSSTSPTDTRHLETLTPARYDPGSSAKSKGKHSQQRQKRRDRDQDQAAPRAATAEAEEDDQTESPDGGRTRPTTTFTELLHEINFPDRGRGVGYNGGTAPTPPPPLPLRVPTAALVPKGGREGGVGTDRSWEKRRI